MPISRLPEATSRELGSTLAVSTPVAVLKELLENAVDAGASFIDTIISLDTLSRIEVRDNGHGISTEDLDALGRSGYTSKIYTFDDVIALGGKSLGFRGVALASINAVADITLTTKTVVDPVATRFQLLPGGGVARKQHVSAPDGTTVSVTKLFSRTPVREKVAARESRKNIIAMKELLQAYALARPHVKLLFRVANGDHTLPWSYSPRPNGDIKDAIIQLFGTELASSCVEHIFCTNQPREPTSPEDASKNPSTTTGKQDSHSLAFEAYLPHSFADATRINKRAFFSVDSRPVFTKRGTLKKLYDIFKTHLSRPMSSSGQNQLPTTPFIRLNIRCEPRSYDINVEPSKDDVLFHDEGYLIKKFKEFMLSVYPVTPTSPGTLPEAALFIPSGVKPHQVSLSSATPRLSLNPQSPPSSGQAITSRSGGPAVCYPSPAAGRQLDSGDNTHNSQSIIQAPSTFVPGQSSFTPINLPSVEEKAAPGAYPTPPSLPHSLIGRHSPSKIALAIRQTECERSPSIRPAAIVGSPAHSMRTSAFSRDNPNPIDRCRIASGGIISHMGDGSGHERCPPIQLHPRLVLDNVLPTPSIQTGGVQSRPNLQSRPFTVDMSTCFMDSDDEAELPRNSAPRPRPPDRGGEIDEAEEPMRNPLEGLNPWSIAKLTASQGRHHQPRPQPVVEDRDGEEMGDRTRRPPPNAKGSFQPRQYNGSNFACQPRKPPSKVPGGAYKRPTMNEARPRGRPEPMVQTKLSRYRAPVHPGHANVRTEEGPNDLIPQPVCSQNVSSSARLPREDPRSYLFNNEEPAVDNPQRKLRRCKTELLPLEKTPLGSETYTLRLTLNVKTQDLENLVDMVSDLDRHYMDGEVDRGLYDNITPDEIQRLVARAKAMLEE